MVGNLSFGLDLPFTSMKAEMTDLKLNSSKEKEVRPLFLRKIGENRE